MSRLRRVCIDSDGTPALVLAGRTLDWFDESEDEVRAPKEFMYPFGPATVIADKQ
jgi:hypothetical protein